MKTYLVALLLTLFLLGTAACGGSDEATPTPTKTPDPAGQIETLPTPTPEGAAPDTNEQPATGAQVEPTTASAPASTDDSAGSTQESATE